MIGATGRSEQPGEDRLREDPIALRASGDLVDRIGRHSIERSTTRVSASDLIQVCSLPDRPALSKRVT